MIINEEIYKIIIDSFKFCQQRKNLFIYGYVIMMNHFHMIISTEEAQEIPSIMRDMKRHISQKISEYLSSITGQKDLFWLKPFHGKKINKLWQEGYHPQAIISEAMFLQKLEYIHHNPVKKGFVERPEYWKYSSARNYMLDDDSIIRLDIDRL